MLFIMMTGSWYWWIKQQNTHEDNAQMDEGKKNVKVVMQPSWVQQEIFALYPA